MALFAALVLIASCLLLVAASPARHQPNCRKCSSREECETLPQNCNYGVYEDNCNYFNCYRGPGETCSNSKRCVDGLLCSCGRCVGCVLDPMECYTRPSLCPSAYQ